VRCDHCAQDGPDGSFCTRCGAHQGTTLEAGDAKTREHRYAAHPGEHVAQPAIFTTLLPHLGHHKIHEFRWAFIAGLAGVLILYLAGLITAAILVSAFLVPVLYVIYLYEAQVYRDEPALVLGFTIGGGVVVGIVVTLFERLIYNPFQYTTNPLNGATVSVGALLILGLLMPVIQEALKPLPALFLPNRNDFPETVDGLVFGVAAGLGFSVAETLIGFSSTLASLILIGGGQAARGGQDRPAGLRIRSYRGKRQLDLAILCLAALPAAVVGLLAAVAVWLDDGQPVLFRQVRAGRNGRPFVMLKLPSARTFIFKLCP